MGGDEKAWIALGEARVSFENRRIARQVRADLAEEFKVYLTDGEERSLAVWFDECGLDRVGTDESQTTVT